MKVLHFIYKHRVILLILIACCCSTPPDLSADTDPYAFDRKKMVLYQIQKRGINDPDVLRSMASVRRHEFVKPALQKKAYQDRPLPIGFGQTISQPYIVAFMTQLLEVDKNSRVLEVGTGSGYQAAILARIVKDVYTIEIVEPLHHRSKTVLNRLGYQNIHTMNADGYFGWEAHAPFDAVIVTCASDFIPPPLIITMALLGFGASGSVVSVIQEKIKKDFSRYFFSGLILFPLFLTIGFVLSTQLVFNPYEMAFDVGQIARAQFGRFVMGPAHSPAAIRVLGPRVNFYFKRLTSSQIDHGRGVT